MEIEDSVSRKEGVRQSEASLSTQLALSSASFPLVLPSESGLKSLLSKYPRLKDLYPATAMQHSLISFSDTEDYLGAYKVQAVLNLGDVDSAKLKRAFEVLVQAHDALRTVFEDGDNGALLQVVLAEMAIDWRQIALDAGSPEDIENNDDVIETLSEKERTSPFKHSQPLLKCLLIRQSENSHVLVLTYHHALLDGWSLTVLIGELSEIYTSLLRSEAPPQLRAVPFKRYVEWLQAQDYGAAQTFWKEYLNGFYAATQISFAKPNVDREYKQCVISRKLSENITGQLYYLAVSEGVTPNSIVQLAWAIVLSKFSRENEVLFGYAVSGRASAAEIDGILNLVGMCLNALPMRIRLSKQNTVREHLASIQQQLECAMDFEYLPFDDIQNLSEIPAGTRLFDSFVTTENLPLDKNAGESSLDVKGITTQGYNNFGLNLVVHPGEELKIDLVYNSMSYSSDHASTLLDGYCQVLSEFSDKIDTPISKIVALTASQIERIHEWNDHRLNPPGRLNIWDRFSELVANQSSAGALVHNGRRWSYGELWQRSLCLRNAWLAAGIKPGEYVALALPKSPEFVATVLSLYALDCAYVPLGFGFPKDRCEYIVSDAGIQWIITDESHIDALSGLGASVLNINCVDTAHEQQALELPVKSAEIPAYIIYTSGTTGKPKGVVITHQNIANFCAWIAQEGWLEEGAKVTQFAPLTFDASVGETFSCLWSGAELHLLDDAFIKDPIAVSHYLKDNKITFAAFPPDYLNEMLPECVDKNSIIITAGSAPSRRLIDTWKTACRYINAYGPTETTVLSSYWRVPENAQTDRIYIGTPVSNTELYVVDQFGQLCADEVVGEIWIGGAGVARAYVNLEELNAEKFTENYFSGRGRMYKTGDLGKRYADGNIEIIGRDDHQVKIRGYRIELGEIEAVYTTHPKVDAAKVVAIEGSTQEKQLALYLAINKEFSSPYFDRNNAAKTEPRQALIREFRDFGRNRLPEYMLPAHYLFLKDLPKTENGKVDLENLPKANDDSVLKETYVSARNDIEQKLVKLWAEVLGLNAERLGVHDNFFEAGGDSLRVMALVKKISVNTGIEITPAKIFRYPSIDLLCRYLESSNESAASRSEAIQRGKTRMEKLKRKKTRDE